MPFIALTVKNPNGPEGEPDLIVNPHHISTFMAAEGKDCTAIYIRGAYNVIETPEQIAQLIQTAVSFPCTGNSNPNEFAILSTKNLLKFRQLKANDDA